MREVIYDDAFYMNIDCNEKERNMKERRPLESRIDFCLTSNYTVRVFQRSDKECLIFYEYSSDTEFSLQNRFS